MLQETRKEVKEGQGENDGDGSRVFLDTHCCCCGFMFCDLKYLLNMSRTKAGCIYDGLYIKKLVKCSCCFFLKNENYPFLFLMSQHTIVYNNRFN